MNDYALEPLLDLRQQAVDDAERKVATALGVVMGLEKRRREAFDKRAEITETINAQRVPLSDKVSGAQVLVIRQYRDALCAEENQVSARLEKIDRDLEGARGALAHARKTQTKRLAELEAVVKHKAAWELDRQSQAARRASDALDEVALRMWNEKGHG